MLLQKKDSVIQLLFYKLFSKTLFSPPKWAILTKKVKKISCRKFRSLGKTSVGISGALNVKILGASSVGQIGTPPTKARTEFNQSKTRVHQAQPEFYQGTAWFRPGLAPEFNQGTIWV